MPSWAKRLAAIALLPLLATACVSTPSISATTDRDADAAASSEVAQATRFDSVAYCEALRNLATSDPSDPSLAAALLEEVMEVSEPTHQPTWSAAYGLMTNADDVAFEDIEQLLLGMAEIEQYASAECGLDGFGGGGSFTLPGGSGLPGELGSDLGLDSAMEELGEELGDALGDAFGEDPDELAFSQDATIPVGPGTQPDRRTRPTATPDDWAVIVNAQVPDGVDLVFDWAVIHEEDDPQYSVTALIPVGWDEIADAFGVSYESDDFEFFTSFEYSSNCQGICLPQPWVQIMDDPSASPFALYADEGDVEVLILQELAEPAGRLMVYREDNGFAEVTVVLTRWSDEADKFFECEAELDDADSALWPVFADACLAAEPGWF